jgi:hypothetical protein
VFDVQGYIDGFTMVNNTIHYMSVHPTFLMDSSTSTMT